MQKGDKVRVMDNSWCVKIEDSEFKKGFPAGVGKYKEPCICKVIATNLKLPIYKHIENDPTDDGQVNDTILRNLETDAIYFTQERFLKKVEEEMILLDITNTELGEQIKQEIKNLGGRI